MIKKPHMLRNLKRTTWLAAIAWATVAADLPQPAPVPPHLQGVQELPLSSEGKAKLTSVLNAANNQFQFIPDRGGLCGDHGRFVAGVCKESGVQCHALNINTMPTNHPFHAELGVTEPIKHGHVYTIVEIERKMFLVDWTFTQWDSSVTRHLDTTPEGRFLKGRLTSQLWAPVTMKHLQAYAVALNGGKQPLYPFLPLSDWKKRFDIKSTNYSSAWTEVTGTNRTLVNCPRDPATRVSGNVSAPASSAAPTTGSDGPAVHTNGVTVSAGAATIMSTDSGRLQAINKERCVVRQTLSRVMPACNIGQHVRNNGLNAASMAQLNVALDAVKLLSQRTERQIALLTLGLTDFRYVARWKPNERTGMMSSVYRSSISGYYQVAPIESQDDEDAWRTLPGLTGILTHNAEFNHDDSRVALIAKELRRAGVPESAIRDPQSVWSKWNDDATGAGFRTPRGDLSFQAAMLPDCSDMTPKELELYDTVECRDASYAFSDAVTNLGDVLDCFRDPSKWNAAAILELEERRRSLANACTPEVRKRSSANQWFQRFLADFLPHFSAPVENGKKVLRLSEVKQAFDSMCQSKRKSIGTDPSLAQLVSLKQQNDGCRDFGREVIRTHADACSNGGTTKFVNPLVVDVWCEAHGRHRETEFPNLLESAACKTACIKEAKVVCNGLPFNP